jgi:ribonuclease HI
MDAAGHRQAAGGNLAPAFAFTDGSCPLNGRPGARASFAALVTGGQFGAAAIVRGEVRPTEYAFVDEGDPERGIRATQAPATPSNNRGELLGIVYAFLALLLGRAVGRVEVISDSEISVNTLLNWLPARLKKGTERELKNYDLVMIAWRLLDLLRAQATEVVLTHTRSHQKAPPASAPSRERFIHRGNAMADEHAALALKGGAPDYLVEVLDAPAVLRALATPS